MKLEVQQPRNHRQTRLPVSKQDKDHREGGGDLYSTISFKGSSYHYCPLRDHLLTVKQLAELILLLYILIKT